MMCAVRPPRPCIENYMPLTDASAARQPRPGGQKSSQQVKFPVKLHFVLEQAARLGFEHILSWLPDGKSFRIHDQIAFQNCVMPLYFPGMGVYKSFRRQLNMYGIHQPPGPQLDVPHELRNAYSHPLFQRGDVPLCDGIQRAKSPRRKKHRPAAVASLDSAVADAAKAKHPGNRQSTRKQDKPICKPRKTAVDNSTLQRTTESRHSVLGSDGSIKLSHGETKAKTTQKPRNSKNFERHVAFGVTRNAVTHTGSVVTPEKVEKRTTASPLLRDQHIPGSIELFQAGFPAHEIPRSTISTGTTPQEQPFLPTCFTAYHKRCNNSNAYALDIEDEIIHTFRQGTI